MATAKQRKAFDAGYRAAVQGALQIGQTVDPSVPFQTTLFMVSHEAQLHVVAWQFDESPKERPEVFERLVEDFDACAAVVVFEAIGANSEGVTDAVVAYGAFPAARMERLVVFIRQADGSLLPAPFTVPDDVLAWLRESLPQR